MFFFILSHFMVYDVFAIAPVSFLRRLHLSDQDFFLLGSFGFSLKDIDAVHDFSSSSFYKTELKIISYKGEKYTIKTLKKVKDDSSALFILDYVSFLKRNGLPSFVVPKIGSSGNDVDDYLVSFYDTEAGGKKYFYMEKWVDGHDLAHKDASSRFYFSLGDVLGGIHSVQQSFKSSYVSTTRYMVENVFESFSQVDWSRYENAFPDRVSDIRFLQGIAESLVEYYNSPEFYKLSKGIIPSDMNIANMKVSSQEEIVGLFDWDEVQQGYLAADICAALVHSGRRNVHHNIHHNTLSDLDVFLYAYMQKNFLSQEDVKAIPHMMRLNVLRIVLMMLDQTVESNNSVWGGNLERFFGSLETVQNIFFNDPKYSSHWKGIVAKYRSNVFRMHNSGDKVVSQSV